MSGISIGTSSNTNGNAIIMERLTVDTMFALLIFDAISGGLATTRTSIYGGLNSKVQR
jgi:hypothetical protein